eukprot:2671122-Prymnesium_polylepis.1
MGLHRNFATDSILVATGVFRHPGRARVRASRSTRVVGGRNDVRFRARAPVPGPAGGASAIAASAATAGATAPVLMSDNTELAGTVSDEQALAELLDKGTILLYGDSICEEFGELYLRHSSINFEYAAHTKMRGSSPDEINKQVFTKQHTLKDDVKEKIDRASLIVLSAGKNIMYKTTETGIAAEVRDLVLQPMLR